MSARNYDTAKWTVEHQTDLSAEEELVIAQIYATLAVADALEEIRNLLSNSSALA